MIDRRTAMRARRLVEPIPLLGSLARRLVQWLLHRRFPGSERYWIDRYAHCGDSGTGSYGELARFKADFLNDFVERHSVTSVVEHGCGDGNQLALAKYPCYLGFDVSPHAVEACRARFRNDPTKRFERVGALETVERVGPAELALSLDVVFHLVEDRTFEAHMSRLFASSSRYVIIFSSDRDEQEAFQPPHVRHRRFSEWVERNAPAWSLIQHLPNPHHHPWDPSRGSFSDFYVYEKR